VGELMEQLVQDGLLVTTKTRNGPGVRTATDADAIPSHLDLQGHLLLPWQWGANFCIGCRADTRTVPGFRCHQQAILNKLLHQLPTKRLARLCLPSLSQSLCTENF